MRKFLYFDCFSGISGDMALGALIHLGADPEKIKEGLALLELDGYELISGPRESSGITGVDIRVLLDEGVRKDEHHHRSYTDICRLIEGSQLKEAVKEMALEIFRVIGEAESRIHGLPLEEVCFHEVGAADSIVDIVGTAIAVDLLGVEAVYCSPVHDGKGFVQCRHGQIPVPVPAVMELLKESGIRLVQEDVDTEMVTPTGLGILKGLKASCGTMPEARIIAAGYGFGKRNTGRFNALRVVLGEEDDKAGVDRVLVLESNLDDESGEILGYTLDRLMGAGALDVYFTPIYMKKCRPATKLSVICREKDGQRLMEIIFRETSTLGVRFYEMNRRVLERRIQTMETEWGPVRFKISTLGDMSELSPEYEDCARIAREYGLPLSEVYDRVFNDFS